MIFNPFAYRFHSDEILKIKKFKKIKMKRKSKKKKLASETIIMQEKRDQINLKFWGLSKQLRYKDEKIN
jgi:hypothetical protein